MPDKLWPKNEDEVSDGDADSGIESESSDTESEMGGSEPKFESWGMKPLKK